jgi:hypothetical protein
MIFWKDKINDWINGDNIPLINKNISKISYAIFFETSPIDFSRNNWGIYKENQIKTNLLTDTKDIYTFDKLSRINIISFVNLSGDCILVCPPNDGKNYSHINNFYKNANKKLIKLFWKKVGEILLKLSKNNLNKYWISTHGTAVSWLHLRICNKPKYYQTKSFII